MSNERAVWDIKSEDCLDGNPRLVDPRPHGSMNPHVLLQNSPVLFRTGKASRTELCGPTIATGILTSIQRPYSPAINPRPSSRRTTFGNPFIFEGNSLGRNR